MTNPNNQPGDSGLKNNQADQDRSDDPRQAKEAGDPRAEGRSQGRPIEEESDTGADARPGDSKDWESGRHQAR